MKAHLVIDNSLCDKDISSVKLVLKRYYSAKKVAEEKLSQVLYKTTTSEFSDNIMISADDVSVPRGEKAERTL